jgi:hypothetical protein
MAVPRVSTKFYHAVNEIFALQSQEWASSEKLRLWDYTVPIVGHLFESNPIRLTRIEEPGDVVLKVTLRNPRLRSDNGVRLFGQSQQRFATGTDAICQSQRSAVGLRDLPA